MKSFCGVNGFKCSSCMENDAFQTEFRDYDLRNLYDPTLRWKTEAEREIAVLNAYDNMSADPRMMARIEEVTRLQCATTLWKVFRIGRITASNLKEVCQTNLTNPSLSLLKKICSSVDFKSTATQYGKDHEAEAYDDLFEKVSNLHKNPVKMASGLVISKDYPCLGASPDGIIICECHGKISVEIKCPYVGRDSADFTESLLKLKDPYLTKNPSGAIVFNQKHKYYHQAIMQLYLTEASFGYFYIWSREKQFIFKIERNDDFWTECREKAVSFFRYIVLREMLFQGYSNSM